MLSALKVFLLTRVFCKILVQHVGREHDPFCLELEYFQPWDVYKRTEDVGSFLCSCFLSHVAFHIDPADFQSSRKIASKSMCLQHYKTKTENPNST